jgi:hypothetical protein
MDPTFNRLCVCGHAQIDHVGDCNRGRCVAPDGYDICHCYQFTLAGVFHPPKGAAAAVQRGPCGGGADFPAAANPHTEDP